MTGAILRRDVHLYGHTVALAGQYVTIEADNDGDTVRVYHEHLNWSFDVDRLDLEIVGREP